MVGRSAIQVLEVLEKEGPVLRRMGARALALFGSAARGEDRPGSDIDLLVDLSPLTFDSYMDLKFHLEDLLHRPVDLVLQDALKPLLREKVLAEKVDVPGL